MNFFHIFSFVFISSILGCAAISSETKVLSSTESLSLSPNRNIVSHGAVFELGLFKPDHSSLERWYLGIWFKTEKTYIVWVANRDKPLSKPNGTLQIKNGNILLLDQTTLVWSTNVTTTEKKSDERSPLVAELHADGNFVLRRHSSNSNDHHHDPDSTFLWQSFDFPTNLLLPYTKLGWTRRSGRSSVLRSWKNDHNDPSSGEFSFGFDSASQFRAIPAIFTWKGTSPINRFSPWLGAFTYGIPRESPSRYLTFTLTATKEEVTFFFSWADKTSKSVLKLNATGVIQLLVLNAKNRRWDTLWTSTTDRCEDYSLCGPDSYCDKEVCNCMSGFEPKNPHAWTSGNRRDGCVRKRPLSCNNGDKFIPLSNVKYPDTSNASMHWGIEKLNECEKLCLSNCSCTAFAIVAKQVGNGLSGCVHWTGELLDVRRYVINVNQILYVRSHEKKKPKTVLIVCLSTGVGIIIIFSAIFCYWRIKKKQARARAAASSIEITLMENLELPLMDFETISIATKHFSDSNKLGKGGFGVVYKGILDGQDIAVKRLSRISGQGINEFKNELRLITKVKHVNLVQLLGYCLNRDEKLLIYEYLENRSLDLYLFDKNQSSALNWPKRFEITKGIARGLSYLHHDSPTMIVHRDLKPSNVLLAKDMTPKISDFGMARIFNRGENEVETTKVVGTYGYMSPEYSFDGTYSEKSDVFSFGVLMLEIVTGMRNRGFADANNGISLLTHVFNKWKEGEWADVIDPILDLNSSSQEVKRCLHIGLLCVQDRAEDRPIMPSVVLMLVSQTESMLQPNPPGYYALGNVLSNVAPTSNTASTSKTASTSNVASTVTVEAR
ncbi:hypothetical protein EUTSA_v10012685mg [Eutrema salsugineum]|uniref:Receptor-like serine/threonine-protein kinase n=1 Tax=Eutrema salsugineum TaxID=72664 RepID=V4KY09_EUTSA|nr:hypothetical protein EUTSA_v10012685mg [Eutrema salsugineum]